MKRFSFRLESLRGLREQAEEQAKLRLAQELAAEAGERERLVAAASRLALARAAARGGSGGALAARQAYIERCERVVAEVAAALTLQQQLVHAAREALAEAAREREALERLRERGLAQHELEARRAEDDALGEVGLAAHRRKVA